MRRLHTFIFLLLILLAGSAWSHAFQVRGGREPAPAPTPARTPRPTPTHRNPPRRFVNVTIVSITPSAGAPPGTTVLPHCEVSLDGTLLEQVTDEQGRLVIQMEPGSAREVMVSKHGYVAPDPVEVVASGDNKEVSFTLTREPRSLKVKTVPGGVKVTLDEVREAESDAEGWLTFKRIDPGVPHKLRGSKEDFHDETLVVVPYKAEALLQLRRDLRTLKVKTNPPQAEVYLDGDRKGTSDAEGVLYIAKIKTERKHELRAAKEGHVTRSCTVLPNYELAVIKLPAVSDTPSPPAGQSSDLSPDTTVEEVCGLPRDYTPQAVVTQQERGPAVTQNAGPTPTPAYTPTPMPTPAPAPAPQPGAQAVTPASAVDIVELAFWDSIKDSKNPQEFAAYLKKYPRGQFVDLARIRMNGLLGKSGGEPEPAATPSAPEPSPTPTPTPAPVTTPTPPPVTAAARANPPTVNAPPAAAGEASGSPALEETTNWLRKNFAAKFTYRYTESFQARGSVSFPGEGSIDFEPVRFEGCRLEWRVFNDVHKVSLSDLDPSGVKVELRRPAPGTTYSIDIWNVILTGAGGKEAFEKMVGGRDTDAKRYWRLVLSYDGEEKARGVAAALGRAIALCGGKAQP